MELTKKERLAYIYQLRILEALYPDEASEFVKHRTALEEGYVLQYRWMFEHLYEELSEADCREILDILDMYRSITFGLEKLADDDPLRQHHLAKFRGFDGNNEFHQMSYVEYFILNLGRFPELKKIEHPSFNSHTPMLDIYRKMLQRLNKYDKKYNLSRAQIDAVLG
jgi:uncharacterized protein YfbU (UPF0304 family)